MFIDAFNPAVGEGGKPVRARPSGIVNSSPAPPDSADGNGIHRLPRPLGSSRDYQSRRVCTIGCCGPAPSRTGVRPSLP